MEQYTQAYSLKNGSVIVNLLDYCGDEDFYAMYKIIGQVLQPDAATYGVDSMCIDGSFQKEGLLVRMCSESADDQCCFVYDAAKLTEQEIAKIQGWIAQVVAAMRENYPKN